MRHLYLIIAVAILAAAQYGCSDKGDGPNGDGKKTTISKEYFPVHDGDFWSYNNGTILRQLSGDTVINEVTCRRLLQGGVTTEAWTLTDERFAQHLLDKEIWFDPPLQIPFNLQIDSTYDVFSYGHFVGDTTKVGSYSGTLTNKGYVSRTVGDNTFDSCLWLDYHIEVLDYYDSSVSTIDFTEYYARGIGLVLSPDDKYLDYAIIAGHSVP